MPEKIDNLFPGADIIDRDEVGWKKKQDPGSFLYPGDTWPSNAQTCVYSFSILARCSGVNKQIDLVCLILTGVCEVTEPSDKSTPISFK